MKFLIPELTGNLAFSEENAWMGCPYLEWDADKEDSNIGTAICIWEGKNVFSERCAQCKSEIRKPIGLHP